VVEVWVRTQGITRAAARFSLNDETGVFVADVVRSERTVGTLSIPEIERIHIDCKSPSVPAGGVSLDQLVSEMKSAGLGDALARSRRRWSELIEKKQDKLTLRALRLRRGLSQAELAQEIGVTQPRIALWEARRESPSFKQIRKLCAALDIQADTLLAALSDE